MYVCVYKYVHKHEYISKSFNTDTAEATVQKYKNV